MDFSECLWCRVAFYLDAWITSKEYGPLPEMGWNWEIGLLKPYRTETYRGTGFLVEPDTVVDNKKNILKSFPVNWKGFNLALSTKRISEGISEWAEIHTGRKDIRFVWEPFQVSYDKYLSESSNGLQEEKEEYSEEDFLKTSEFKKLFADIESESSVAYDEIIARHKRILQDETECRKQTINSMVKILL